MLKSWFRYKTKSMQVPLPAATQLPAYSSSPFQPALEDDFSGIYDAEYSYIRNVVAFRCINLISSAVASVRIRIVDEHNNPAPIDNPVVKLLNKPNHSESYCEFMESIVAHKLISGNAYVLMLKNRNSIKELHVLRPDKVKIVQSTGNLPYSYVYTANESESDKTTEFYVNQITGSSDIIHMKNFHPLNDWYGLSPLKSARSSIDQYNQSGEWNRAMLKNGARPSGALIVKESANGNTTLSTEQYIRLKNQIDEYYSGSVNAGRPILLEGGLEWKEMSLSPKDMDFISMKHSTARDIALALGVPPQLIGIPGDNTYSNLVEARLSLWEQTILPVLNSIIMHLNEKFVRTISKCFRMTYNKDDIEIFIEQRQKLWRYVENATFMTVNEKRKLFGLPIRVDGDVIPGLSTNK